MATHRYDNEILVSHKSAPTIITRGDMRQAVSLLRHRHSGGGHHTPALDAVLRLISAAPADLIKQVRVVEDTATPEAGESPRAPQTNEGK